MFTISNSLTRQKTTVFLQNALFQHRTPVLQIFKAIFEVFFENPFSLLTAPQILRADRSFSASPRSLSHRLKIIHRQDYDAGNDHNDTDHAV